MLNTRRGFIAQLLAVPVAVKLKSYVADPFFIKQSGYSLNKRMDFVRGSLPAGIEFYEVGGQTVFALYGSSGGLTTTLVCYFVDKARSLASCCEFCYNDDEATINKKIVAALSHFESVNLNGGPLPRMRKA